MRPCLKHFFLLVAASTAVHCNDGFDPLSEEWSQAKRVQVDLLRPATYPLAGIGRLAFKPTSSLDSTDLASGVRDDLQAVQRFDLSGAAPDAWLRVSLSGSEAREDVAGDTAMQDGNVMTTYTRTVTQFVKASLQVTGAADDSSMAKFDVTTQAQEVQGTLSVWGKGEDVDKTYLKSRFMQAQTSELLRQAKRRAAREMARALVPYYETVTILLYTIDLPDAAQAASKAQAKQWTQARALAQSDLQHAAGQEKDKKLNAKAHYNLAMMLLNDGATADAIVHLHGAVALHPGDPFQKSLNDALAYQKAEAQLQQLNFTPQHLPSL